MLLSQVKSIVTNKITVTGGLRMPEDDVLADLAHEALRFVASRCVPSELLRDSEADVGESVFRFIEGGKYILMPDFPDFSNTVKHLMIDEELSFAVINKMVALMSRDALEISRYESEATKTINRYKANAIRIGYGATITE